MQININKKIMTTTISTQTFTPSRYQQAVYDLILHGAGNGIVEATAGSGKTTTIVNGIYQLIEKHQANGHHPPKVLVCAFNTDIHDVLVNKFKPVSNVVTVKKFHGLGMKLIQAKAPLNVQDNKYYHICNQVMQEYGVTPDSPVIDIAAEFIDLCKYARLSLVNLKSPNLRDDLWQMCQKFQVNHEYFSTIWSWVPYTIELGNKLAYLEGLIDFVDMIYLPNAWGINPRWKYDWVFVDEAQDLSECMLRLMLKYLAPGGRVIAVGDRNQAIYGFAGANSDSMDKLADILKPTILPLSICYRCPTSHIKLAQELVKEIQPSPNAIEGKLIKISMPAEKNGGYSYKEIIPLIQEGDLIICRKTAPLISLCIKLILQRIPAKVKGRDIGAGLNKIIDEVIKLPGFTYSQFLVYLQQYTTAKIQALKAKEGNESQVQSLMDRVEGLKSCYEGFSYCKSSRDLRVEIDKLFQEGNAVITLCSVHKAKGLEAERIIVLHDELMPMTWKNQSDESYEQELNLKFIAYTRSLHTLILATGIPLVKERELKYSDMFENYEDDCESYLHQAQYDGDDNHLFTGYFTFSQIRERYRELAKRYHPDNLETGNEQLMKELNRQYENMTF